MQGGKDKCTFMYTQLSFIILKKCFWPTPATLLVEMAGKARIFLSAWAGTWCSGQVFDVQDLVAGDHQVLVVTCHQGSEAQGLFQACFPAGHFIQCLLESLLISRLLHGV